MKIRFVITYLRSNCSFQPPVQPVCVFALGVKTLFEHHKTTWVAPATRKPNNNEQRKYSVYSSLGFFVDLYHCVRLLRLRDVDPRAYRLKLVR